MHAHEKTQETLGGYECVYYLDIVVMVSWVYTFVQTHQIVYIKYVQFIGYQLHLNKFFFFNFSISYLPLDRSPTSLIGQRHFCRIEAHWSCPLLPFLASLPQPFLSAHSSPRRSGLKT